MAEQGCELETLLCLFSSFSFCLTCVVLGPNLVDYSPIVVPWV